MDRKRGLDLHRGQPKQTLVSGAACHMPLKDVFYEGTAGPGGASMGPGWLQDIDFGTTYSMQTDRFKERQMEGESVTDTG